MRKRNALTRLMLIGFRAAHNEPATEEFLVVQFLHGAFRFLDGLHLHKRKTFRALVVPIAYDLCVITWPTPLNKSKRSLSVASKDKLPT